MVTRPSLMLALLLLPTTGLAQDEPAEGRRYENTLTVLENPRPILADHPEFFQPVREVLRFEAAPIIDDPEGDLHVRAWRFSYNARGIIEMQNTLNASETALIVVHPWGIDDGQGWNTPEPAGVADFCTPIKNHLSHEHIKQVLNPFIQSLRGKVSLVMYSQPHNEDPIRKKLYRSFRGTPTEAMRAQGAKELHEKLNSFEYKGEPVWEHLHLGEKTPVIDYFKQFPGLDSSARYNNEGFWELPIPVVKSIETHPDDVMIYDAEGYPSLRDFLLENGIRHVLLTGYATDMCYKSTTAGYENLSQDFNVFLVADATMATFPANSSPAYATNASISFASLQHLITQVSWITCGEEGAAKPK